MIGKTMKIAYFMPDKTEEFAAYFQPFITPTQDLTWQSTRFILNPTEGVFDGAVVFQSMHSLSRAYTIKCPPTRTLIVVKEPPDFCFLQSAYLAQFAMVIDHDPRTRHPGKLHTHGCHHPFVNVPYAEMEPTQLTEKSKLISAVTSAKADTVGHRKRLALMCALKEHFGDDLDWWGRGIQDLTEPKLAGLRDYKYHICMENSAWPNYWTEKILDAFSANCIPIYWGAPNVGDFFDSDAIIPIDIDDVDRTISRIEDAIAADLWQQQQATLARARKKILTEYNIYEMYSRLLREAQPSSPQEVTIRPQTHFKYGLKDRVANKLFKLRYANKA